MEHGPVNKPCGVKKMARLGDLDLASQINVENRGK